MKEVLREIEAAGERLASGRHGPEDQLVLLERLRSALEELRVVQESLDAQNADLSQLQAQLEDERRRYLELFQLAPDAYLVADDAGKVLEANVGAARLFEVPERFLIGKPLAAYVVPSARRRFRTEFARLNGPVSELEVPFFTRSGRQFFGALRIAGGGNGDRDDGTRRCIVRDLTPERQAQLEARMLSDELTERGRREAQLEAQFAAEGAERRRLRLLLERLHEGVIAIDPELRVQFTNAEAMRLLAPASLEEGRPLPDLTRELALVTLAGELFAPGATLVERVAELRDSGRILSVVGVPAEQTNLALLVIVDVSARERRERAERDFVANAAHELRTPLTAITSAVEVLLGGAKETPEARDRFLAHLKRETDRLNLLTKALLLLARVETGSERPRAEVIDLRALLEGAADAIDPARSVAVEVDCPSEVGALCNRDLAAQALATVAGNAAKYTRAGRIRLSAYAANGSAVIEVADTGPGIPEPERELVRRRFYRLGDRDGDGFGLGLAIADQAVAATGGRLEIDGAEAGGTIVRIVLPGAELIS